MRTRPLASIVSLSLCVAALVGCTNQERGDEPAPPAQEQDFVQQGGVSLTSAQDPGLRISLMLLDGVKPSTKNKRFIKATVMRGGGSFGAFCSLRGELDADKASAVVSCSKGVTTVSNDDDESLSFDIVIDRTAQGELLSLANAFYAGDGTFLGAEAAVLGHTDGPSNARVKLTAKEGTSANKNVLMFARTLLDAATPLLKERVLSEEVAAPVAVKTISLRVNDKLDLSVSLALGRTGRLSAVLPAQSVLKTQGQLASGLLPAAGISARLTAAVPR